MLKKLEQRLGAILKLKMASQSEGAQAIDWEVLLEILFGFLMTFLEGCLTNRSVDDVSSDIKKPGLFGQWALKRAIKKESRIPEHLRGVSYEAIMDTLGEAPDDELRQGVQEFKNTLTDWGLW